MKKMALTAERVQQLLAIAMGIRSGKVRLEPPENPPSDTEVALSVDRILARHKGGRL